ncbi:WD repeat-containing protein 78 [Homalodisca vitripennis]|nr:WD repeat-containing protein 78 [Homalodisca vitripennis]
MARPIHAALRIASKVGVGVTHLPSLIRCRVKEVFNVGGSLNPPPPSAPHDTPAAALPAAIGETPCETLCPNGRFQCPLCLESEVQCIQKREGMKRHLNQDHREVGRCPSCAAIKNSFDGSNATLTCRDNLFLPDGKLSIYKSSYNACKRKSFTFSSSSSASPAPPPCSLRSAIARNVLRHRPVADEKLTLPHVQLPASLSPSAHALPGLTPEPASPASNPIPASPARFLHRRDIERPWQNEHGLGYFHPHLGQSGDLGLLTDLVVLLCSPTECVGSYETPAALPQDAEERYPGNSVGGGEREFTPHFVESYSSKDGCVGTPPVDNCVLYPAAAQPSLLNPITPLEVTALLKMTSMTALCPDGIRPFLARSGRCFQCLPNGWAISSSLEGLVDRRVLSYADHLALIVGKILHRRIVCPVLWSRGFGLNRIGRSAFTRHGMHLRPDSKHLLAELLVECLQEANRFIRVTPSPHPASLRRAYPSAPPLSALGRPVATGPHMLPYKLPYESFAEAVKIGSSVRNPVLLPWENTAQLWTLLYPLYFQNVVAVGYGYVRGSEELDGLVCCWSVKNPSQPERVFHMRSPVTTISFSRTQPNLLALGCYNGAVIVLNIASNTGDKLVVTG